MSVVGVSARVREVVAAAVTAGGLTCRKYDTWDIRAGNIATLGLIRPDVMEATDQAYGYRNVVVPVLVYQVIGGSLEKGLEYQERNVEKVIDGLGRDRTLGGTVASSAVTSDPVPSFYRGENGQEWCVVSFELTVTPRPNMASV